MRTVESAPCDTATARRWCGTLGRTWNWRLATPRLVQSHDITSSAWSRYPSAISTYAWKHGVAERARELRGRIDIAAAHAGRTGQHEKLAALTASPPPFAHELNTPIGNCVMVATTLDAKARFSALIHGGSIRRSPDQRLCRRLPVRHRHIWYTNLQQAHNLIHSFGKRVAVDQTSDRRREFELR